ncbi:hypothetical protein ACTFR8_21970 [Bacillus cereus group sp. MYBK15-3]|uniref:hypothetical protein n=1 Tax=unclassified Bacillus cereus group TaxID=2750818 RepID=UPI003F7B0127
MKTLCKKHGKEYMDEQAPKAVVIKRDEDNCERCEEIKNGVNLKLFHVTLSTGQWYEENVCDEKVIVAADLEDARIEAVKLMMGWYFYKGGFILEDCGSAQEVKYRSYWSKWENGERVKDYVFDSEEDCDAFNAKREGIVNFSVKELEIENGYKVTSVNAEKLQDCKVGAE